jgi:hypothetical protein
MAHENNLLLFGRAALPRRARIQGGAAYLFSVPRTSKSAVPQVSKPAGDGAGLEAGDTAGLETCATQSRRICAQQIRGGSAAREREDVVL